jgi:2-oxoglutarate ferredoxin oxidoreductase subunit alpha
MMGVVAMSIDFNFMVGGEAGQGVQSIGYLLAKSFARGGYYVFADQDYESRVRGGHNFFRIRVKDSEVNAVREDVNILVALNKESVELHDIELKQSGIIICDESISRSLSTKKQVFAAPLVKLAQDISGEKVMENTVALGIVIGIVNFKIDIVNEVLTEHFGKGPVSDENIKALKAGYEFARENPGGVQIETIAPLESSKKLLLNGNEAIALGAIASNCRFVSAYPMTPATTIMEYIAVRGEKLGIVVVQPEDEIAAVNMIVGSSFAGARSMTATSGSGFCLMVEGLGMAAISETPIVIVNCQRPGPAVGLPTRTEQGDLLFSIHAHQGDFPRAVLAPSSVEDAFWETVKAFNLADKYQIPVIILSDQFLSSSYKTVDRFEMDKVKIDRGIIYSAEKETAGIEYKRHRITETGISPRAFPGDKNALVITDSDEHDESGHMIEDAGQRIAQVQKRLKKFTSIQEEISPGQLYGPATADTTLISWGSTYGTMREAVSIMLEQGLNVNMLHLNDLWPFPAQPVTSAINNAKKCVVVENNATGQLARLIKQETGKNMAGHILKFDGRPFTPEKIISQLKGVV